MPPTNPSRRRYLARRLEILRAAGRAFRTRGFAETGMRDIAEEFSDYLIRGLLKNPNALRQDSSRNGKPKKLANSRNLADDSKAQAAAQ